MALSSRVKEVLDWIDHFFHSLSGGNRSSHTFCSRCIQTASLPSPSTLPEIFTSIQLDNAFTSRVARETLINSSLPEVAKEVDDWRSSQASLFLRFITDTIISADPNPETIARDAADLHPDLQKWISDMRDSLRTYTRLTLVREACEETVDQQTHELVEEHIRVLRLDAE